MSPLTPIPVAHTRSRPVRAGDFKPINAPKAAAAAAFPATRSLQEEAMDAGCDHVPPMRHARGADERGDLCSLNDFFKTLGPTERHEGFGSFFESGSPHTVEDKPKRQWLNKFKSLAEGPTDATQTGISFSSSQPSHTTTANGQRRPHEQRSVQVTQTDHGERLSAMWHSVDTAGAAPPPAVRRMKQQGLKEQGSHENLGSKLKSSFGGSLLKLAGSDASRGSIRHGRTRFQPRHELSPTIRTPNTPHKPSGLRHAYTTETSDDRNSDPFTSTTFSKPMSKPFSPGGAVVTPWDFQERGGEFTTVNGFLMDAKNEAVRTFMNRHPPPPEPQSPTRLAGRALRATKSDTSIRTAVTIAPSLASSKRSVETVNPDSSPLTYISKVARSPALPSSPADPYWNEAIEYAKRELAADRKKEAQRASEETAKKKDSPKHAKDTERQARIMAAKRLIVRSSIHGWAPTIDYSEMNAEELEAYGAAIEEEIAKGGPVKGIKKLFKQVGEKQHEIVRHVAEAKALKQIEAAKKAEAGGEDGKADMHINEALRMLEGDECLDAADHAGLATAIREDGRTDTATTPGKGRNGIMQELFNRSPDHETLYGDLDDERRKALLALSAVSPASSVHQLVGLGICAMEGAVSTRDFGATARLTMRKDTELMPAEHVSCDHDQLSIYSQNEDGTLSSPLDLEPLSVPRSSLLHLDQFENHNAFVPRRNESFVRKINEQSRVRALKLKGSHPAMRGGVDEPDARPVSPFIDLPLTLSEQKLKLGQLQWKRDSILRCDDPGGDDSRDSFTNYVDSDEHEATLLRRRSPTKQLTVDTNALFPEDEGYHTARLDKQRFSAMQELARLQLPLNVRTPREFGQAMSELDSWFDGDSPDSEGSDSGSEGIEYIDNPDYDPALDSSRNGEWDDEQNDDEVEEISSEPASQRVIEIDIDDVIAHWEYSTQDTRANSPRWNAVNFAQCENMQALRTQIGLSPLKLRSSSGQPKHPNHGFAWNTEKIMCKLIHNPPPAPNTLPGMPNFPGGIGVDMSVVAQRFFTPEAASAPASPTPALKLPRCEDCLNHCCLYAELLLKAAVKTRSAAEEHFRLQAEEKVEKLRRFYPNGIEGFSTFLTCMECSRMVCPSCATVCEDGLCRQVMCKAHSAEGRCSYHQYV
ncbi:hypothetical protein LTR85_000371 [Meristemomyces frigidus]|nr:hypothetical protein LTR85_000371 [Meristemomyces frigidus]